MLDCVDWLLFCQPECYDVERSREVITLSIISRCCRPSLTLAQWLDILTSVLRNENNFSKEDEIDFGIFKLRTGRNIVNSKREQNQGQIEI